MIDPDWLTQSNLSSHCSTSPDLLLVEHKNFAAQLDVTMLSEVAAKSAESAKVEEKIYFAGLGYLQKDQNQNPV